MTDITIEDKIKEIVAVFKNASVMEHAIDEMITDGINPAYISVLANEKEVKERLKIAGYQVQDLADNPATPRTEYIPTENVGALQGGIISGLTYIATLSAAGAVIASGGSVAALLAATAVAGSTSGAIGVILAKIIGKIHADRLEDQLAHGGLLVWVKITDDNAENLVRLILKKYKASDIHMHTFDSALVTKEEFA